MRPETIEATPSTTSGVTRKPSGAIAHARPSTVVASAREGPTPSRALTGPASVAPITLARPPTGEDPSRAVRPKRKYAICDEQERGAYGHVPDIRDHNTSC